MTMLAVKVGSFLAESTPGERGVGWRSQPQMVASIMLLVGVKTSSGRRKHLKSPTGKPISLNNSLAGHSHPAWNVLKVVHIDGF